MMQTVSWPKYIAPLFVYFAVFVVNILSPVVTTSQDSRWFIHTALSLVKERNTNLDEYVPLGEAPNDYTVEFVNGHVYTIFPIGTAIMAVPFVFMLDQSISVIRAHSPRLEGYLKRRFKLPGELTVASIYPSAEHLIASGIVALSALIIYLMAALFFEQKLAVFASLIYAFCTSAWSTAGRSLFQHGPSMLLLAVSLYLILLSRREKPFLVQFVALPLTFSFIVRPTNSIGIILFSLYVLLQHRKYFLRYALWSLAVIIPFLIYNLSVYHYLISAYYLPQRLGENRHLFEALLGNLFSPARGLLVYSPILVFALAGMILSIRQNPRDKLHYALLLIIFLHWLSISSFPHWWGGHCYGPRFFTDMMPFFLYFLLPVFGHLLELKSRAVVISVFVLFMLISVFMHGKGAMDINVYFWNEIPENVDKYPARLWDWRDAQFLR